MKKLFFCLSAIASTFSVNAQNNWYSKPTKTITTTAVGIGTYTPASGIPLYVVNNDTTFGGSQLVAGFERLGVPAQSAKVVINITDFNDGFGDVLFDAQGNADIALRTKGGYGGVLVLKNNGNLGVGISNPSAKLHVSGSLRFDGLGTTNAGYVLTATDALGNAAWQPAPPVLWNKTGNDINYVTGKVGIGMPTGTTYESQLQVMQAVGAPKNFRVLDMVEGNRKVFFTTNLSDGAYSYQTINNDFGLFWADGNGPAGTGRNGSAGLVIAAHAASSAGIRIDANGSVGIGTNLSSNTRVVNGVSVPNYYMLSVAGALRAKEVVIEIDWADYVFDKNYKLMPLNELDKFITENKHLPNINSAADIEANGLMMGNMQVKQMEKIEELSLYIIEINKRLNELEEQNKKLEQKNETLESAIQQIQNK